MVILSMNPQQLLKSLLPLISQRQQLQNLLSGVVLLVVSSLRAKSRACALEKCCSEHGGGVPVSELPVQRNHLGKRMLNVTTMKALGGIDPKWMTIRGGLISFVPNNYGRDNKSIWLIPVKTNLLRPAFIRLL